MSKDSWDLPPVLAAPPQHARRRRIIVAIAAHLAVILGTAGAIALIQVRSAAGKRIAHSVAIKKRGESQREPDVLGWRGLLSSLET